MSLESCTVHIRHHIRHDMGLGNWNVLQLCFTKGRSVAAVVCLCRDGVI